MTGLPKLAKTLFFMLMLPASAIAEGEQPDGTPTSADTPSYNKWWCLKSVDDITALTFEQADVRVGNFIIKEGVEILTSTPTIELSATVTNRSGKKIAMSISFLGVNSEHPNIAMSARPPFGWVDPNTNTEIKSAIYADKGLLAADTGRCLLVSAFVSKL